MSNPSGTPLRNGTVEQRIAEIRERLGKVTPGPWFVWDGEEYSGGGRDLCIGAGSTWLANMDHRTCERWPAHMKEWEERALALDHCEPQAHADVCSLAAEFTEEQEATANFIAWSREDVPYLLSVIDALLKQQDELMAENDHLRHPNDA